jgi:DDE domain
LSNEIRRYRKPVGTTWLVDETYGRIQGTWRYVFRGVDQDGQVLDCWLSRTRDPAAAEAFFRRAISSTGCLPEHVVTDKATFHPAAIRTCAPDAKHTATGFYNPVMSTNRCERDHGYVESRIRPVRGLKRFVCATRLLAALGALHLIARDFVRVPPIGAPCTGGGSYVRARHIATLITRPGQILRNWLNPRRIPPDHAPTYAKSATRACRLSSSPALPPSSRLPIC